MSVIDEFEQHRDDLEALLVEVLGSLLDADEVSPSWGDPIAAGPVVRAHLAILDSQDESYTMVEVEASLGVVRHVGARMLNLADPSPDDLLDAMAELGNIVAGNVKSLVRHSCRLSLPVADLVDGPSGEPDSGVRVSASVLASTLNLTVRPAGEGEPGAELTWPGTRDEEVLETQP